MAQKRSTWGHVRRLPSGRHQASHVDPNGKRVNAPHTFTTKGDAQAWLAVQRAALETGSWRPVADKTTVDTYAQQWLRTHKVSARTKYQHEKYYDKYINPAFGEQALSDVKPAHVRQWYAALPQDKPSACMHAYRVLAQIFKAATEDGIINESPVHIKGANVSQTVREGRALTVPEVAAIADHMPPDKRLAVLLGGLCALRPGETLALRRRDVDLIAHTLRIRETASKRYGTAQQVGPTKTKGSVRTVNYPEQLTDDIRKHLTAYVDNDRTAHLFPSPKTLDHPISYNAFVGAFRQAVKDAGMDDIKPHDLRHTGLTLAASTGATTRELMARAGHTSPTVAMKYQHAVRDRDRAIADALGTALTTAREQSDGQHEDEDHNDE